MGARDEQERLRGYVEDELRASAVYRTLADQVGGEQRAVLLRLAAGEERHARHWQRVLDPGGDQGGVRSPSPAVPRTGRLRLLTWIVRAGGLLPVLALLERREAAEIARYGGEPHAPLELVAEERAHAELLNAIAPGWRARVAGTLRAGVFGMSDGAVSNLALVTGVIGSGAPRGAVIVAGIAGLLAGALSMAVGEYVSVASQREILTGGVDGEPPDEAIGSPLRAAGASLAAFAVGAVVPLLPFLLLAGTAAALVAVAVTGLTLYALGAAISLLTAKPAWRSGGRQLALGLGAAGATYVIGQLVGTVVT